VRHRDWRHSPPRWTHHRQFQMHSRRFVMGRFIALVGGLTFLFLVALGIVLALVLNPDQPLSHSEGIFALAICGVPLIFLVGAALIGRWGFQRIGTPIAEIMSAAEAVAKGDLSVRVNDKIPGEFGRLARSFNHMTSELQRAEQQRRNMTADIAHELRTPLHLIQGNLEGMQDGVYEPNPENLDATLEETRLLIRLVSDLQTLSLAEAGQLPLHPVRIPVADLLSDVVTSFSTQATEQEVTLQLNLASEAALELEADPDRLDQALSNLVANALRYTPCGGKIVLSAEAIPQGVRLRVSDTGQGIPPEDLPYVFDRFWRGDRARTRTGGAGSGLGLAIARQLIQAHGGTISVESQPGEGTTFTIELPVEED